MRTMTAEFRSTLDTRLEDEFAGTDRLLVPFVFYSELLGDEIVVPKDFITDYASVPRMVGAYLLFGGKGKRAAVIHDWLYSCGKVPRDLCDLIFREALQASRRINDKGEVTNSYSWFTIAAMYRGVQVGGESHYVKENHPQEEHVVDAMEAA